MKLGVLMGGISSEREVSLNTGNEIIQHLDKEKYDILPIIINTKEELIKKVEGIDMIFIALHGEFGEDGTAQAILDTLNIPYTGCSFLSSAICMNKDLSKTILRSEGIDVPDSVILRKNNSMDIDISNIANDLDFPLVVKPNSGGSSVATFIIENERGLAAAIYEAFQYDKEVMVEQYIKGDEITCSILNGKVLPIISIHPNSIFFDYTSKYTEDAAEEVVVEFETTLQKHLETIALTCYNSLRCRVYARVDMILKNNKPYVLEVNTLPGMTKNSLFPKSAQAAGISFSQLLDLIIQYSLEKEK